MMNSAPPGPNRLGWRNHKLALRHVGLLYRCPRNFVDAFKEDSRNQALENGLFLYLHILPYLIIVSVLGRMAVTRSLPNSSWAYGIEVGITGGIASGIALGIAFGIALGIAGRIADGIEVGIAEAIAFAIVFGIVGGIAFGIAFGIEVGTAEAIALGIAEGIAFVISWMRLYYEPLYFWMAWPIPLPRLYRFHPVAWDDLCLVPFPGLDRLLIAYASRDLEAAQMEIERLITSYPSQRAAALRARVVLIARESAQVAELTQLDAILAKLPEGTKRFLLEARQIRDWVGKIANIQARLNTTDRAVFRQPYAQSLVTEIENFQTRIGGFDFLLAKEFKAAAENWKQIALWQQKAAEATAKEPAHQVFRAGDPIDRSKEAFVPRDAVVGALEQQIMLSTGCPGIILYGRRRVGKSTVLRNLDGFLPPSVIPIPISMQHPEMLTSLASLVRHLVRQVNGRQPLPLSSVNRCQPQALWT